MNNNIMIFDIETDGYNSIIEIAYYICNDKLDILNQYKYYINDGIPKQDFFKKIDISIVEREGLHSKIVIENFINDLNKCKYVVGHNIKAFDIPKIKKYCDLYSYTLNVPIIHDTMHKARTNGLKPYKLSNVYTSLCGDIMDDTNAHTALYDVEITYKCYKKMIENKWFEF